MFYQVKRIMEHYLDSAPASKYTEESTYSQLSKQTNKQNRNVTLSSQSVAAVLFAFLARGHCEPGLRGDGWLWMPSEQLLPASLNHDSLAFGVLHR